MIRSTKTEESPGRLGVPPSPEFALANYFERMPKITPTVWGNTRPSFDSHFFLGNEDVSPEILSDNSPGIRNVGGDLIGCGLGMALQLAYLARSDRLIVFDVDPIVTKVLWPMIITHFAQAPTRIDFIASILFEELSDEQRSEFISLPTSEIRSRLIDPERRSEFPSRVKKFAESFEKLLTPYFDNMSEIPVSDLCQAVAHDVRSRLTDARTTDKNRADYYPNSQSLSVSAYVPSFHNTTNPSFLHDDNEYTWVRELVLSDRCIVATANMMSDDFDKVIKQLGCSKPRIIYIDNLPAIVPGEDGLGKRYLEGMSRIQERLAEDTTLVASMGFEDSGNVLATPLPNHARKLLDISRYLASSEDELDLDTLGRIHGRLIWGFKLFGRDSAGLLELYNAFLPQEVIPNLQAEFYDGPIFSKITKDYLTFETAHDFWTFVNKELGPEEGRPHWRFDPAEARLIEVGFHFAGVIENLE